MIMKGLNPDMFTQEFVQLLVETAYPKKKIRDIVPVIFGSASPPDFTDSILYFGAFTMVGAADLFYPGGNLSVGSSPYQVSDQKISVTHNPVLFWAVFPAGLFNYQFIGWQITTDGGISIPAPPVAPSVSMNPFVYWVNNNQTRDNIYKIAFAALSTDGTTDFDVFDGSQVTIKQSGDTWTKAGSQGWIQVAGLPGSRQNLDVINDRFPFLFSYNPYSIKATRSCKIVVTRRKNSDSSVVDVYPEQSLVPNQVFVIPGGYIVTQHLEVQFSEPVGTLGDVQCPFSIFEPGI